MIRQVAAQAPKPHPGLYAQILKWLARRYLAVCCMNEPAAVIVRVRDIKKGRLFSAIFYLGCLDTPAAAL